MIICFAGNCSVIHPSVQEPIDLRSMAKRLWRKEKQENVGNTRSKRQIRIVVYACARNPWWFLNEGTYKEENNGAMVRKKYVLKT
jgi:hypothetical protein